MHFLLGFLNQERAQGRLKNIPNDFEVIIDYRGRRPPVMVVTPSNGLLEHLWMASKTYTHIRDNPETRPLFLELSSISTITSNLG